MNASSQFRPKRATSRRRQWPLRRLVLAVVVLAAVAAADRTGLFGRTADDVARYDGKSFTVCRHIDGDTFDVNIPDVRFDHATTRIRLLGVDTPETLKPDTPVQHFGPEASKFTQRMTFGQDVRLQLAARRTRGTYHRLLAYVYLPDGRMLNRLLIEAGYAYADPRFAHPLRVDFAAAMARARKAGVGLWAEARPSDLPAYLSRSR